MQSVGVIIFYAIAALSVTAIVITWIKTKRFFSALFLSVFEGIGSLFAVNLIGSFFSVHIAVNPFSLVLSSFLGAPGVIMLLFSNVITR